LNTVSDVVVAEWKKLIDETLHQAIEITLNPHAIREIEEYRWRVGLVGGLRLSLELFEQAQEIVAKRD
jgi:hypothetical protein